MLLAAESELFIESIKIIILRESKPQDIGMPFLLRSPGSDIGVLLDSRADGRAGGSKRSGRSFLARKRFDCICSQTFRSRDILQRSLHSQLSMTGLIRLIAATAIAEKHVL